MKENIVLNIAKEYTVKHVDELPDKWVFPGKEGLEELEQLLDFTIKVAKL